MQQQTVNTITTEKSYCNSGMCVPQFIGSLIFICNV